MTEPVFKGQEMGAVYFFSRYWDRLPEFKNKKLYDIRPQFPDASMVDVSGAKEVKEAIEFEYALSSFQHHNVQNHVKKLEDYASLYIVYWEHDKDERELRAEIQKKGFDGKIKFVCLNRYFSPVIEPGLDRLRAFWQFDPDGKKFTETYTFDTIKERTKALEKHGAITLHQPDKDLYRCIGFSKDGSDYIECDHWGCIHLFTTTTKFHSERIPQRLYFKPKGCDFFNGYIEIWRAFTVEKKTKELERYFKDFYFYVYDHDEHTCFVYSRFKELPYGRETDAGRALYKYLDKREYDLGNQGSIVIDSRKDMKAMDDITDRVNH
jgi:hypothetical protein